MRELLVTNLSSSDLIWVGPKAAIHSQPVASGGLETGERAQVLRPGMYLSEVLCPRVVVNVHDFMLCIFILQLANDTALLYNSLQVAKLHIIIVMFCQLFINIKRTGLILDTVLINKQQLNTAANGSGKTFNLGTVLLLS